jgi:hypothetical protein
MTLGDAKVYIESMGLILSNVNPPEQGGNMNVYVYRQFPEVMTPDGRPNSMRSGQIVDLWVQAEKPVKNDSTGNSPANDY